MSASTATSNAPVHRRSATTRMIYFAPSDLLVPRVERQCTMRFCEALARLGVDVYVLSLDVQINYNEPTRKGDLFDVYGVDNIFDVRVIPSWSKQESDRVSRSWRTLSYGAVAFWDLVLRRRAYEARSTVLYFRNYLLSIPLLVLKRLLRDRVTVIFEAHTFPTKTFQRFVFRCVDGVVTISGALADDLVAAGYVRPSRIIAAHQGVNLTQMEERRLSRPEARHRLALPLDRRLVVYTGKVFVGSKEIEYLIEAAQRLPADVLMVIVGGRSDHVERFRRQVAGSDNVLFTGFIPPGDVFLYQIAADVLVGYYPRNPALNDYRSPGKLFEYMAARRPIILADYRSVHEVLGEDGALLIEPDRPEALTLSIKRVFDDPGLAARLADSAYDRVAEYTWEKRAERVLAFARELHHVPAPDL
jgi:glycosyltransferase involved in cell wall biosynthesis